MYNILKKLKDLESDLYLPFPHEDTDKIQEDFHSEFLKLSDEENDFTGDFHSYGMNIAGSLSYVLAGKTSQIPKRQVEMLQFSFFDLFIQYKFLEGKTVNYKYFQKEYKSFEEARKLLVILLST
ncbi:YxiJ family protein [Brevibacillus sp. B_LB10_24]|uniref:YxiJ family protein n=1 Tax=Brevibacillus sp. B_LB10_24 TaxID=3380645 RepID=UPI0038BD238F